MFNDEIKSHISTASNNKEIKPEIMRNALICIAREMRRFQTMTEQSGQDGDEKDECQMINICNTKVISKIKQINKLKDGLNLACTVAKIIMSVKERERESLNNQLNIARIESAYLYQNNKQTSQVIEKLKTENMNIYNGAKLLSNCIQLGYDELQQIRAKLPEDIPVVSKLKELIIACGQYYADYANEHERCCRLEQRNRFLKNKVTILEKNLAAAANDPRYVEKRDVWIQKDYTKDSTKLGDRYRKGIPIEVVPMAYVPIKNKIIASFGGEIKLRSAVAKAGPVVTDNGNFILDWIFNNQDLDWEHINNALTMIPGVVETGLFVKMCQKAYFGQPDGKVVERS